MVCTHFMTSTHEMCPEEVRYTCLLWFDETCFLKRECLSGNLLAEKASTLLQE